MPSAKVKRSLKDEMYKAITHYSRPENIGRSLVYRPLEVAQILMDHPALPPTLCPHLEFVPGFADEFLALITTPPIRWTTRGALFKAVANKLNQVMRVSVAAALGLKSSTFTFMSISKSQLDERMNRLEAVAISGDVDYPLLNRYKDLITRERWPALEYGMEGMGIMGDLTDVAAVIRTIKLIKRGVGPSSSSLIVDGRPSNEALKAEVDAFSILLYQLRVLKDDPHSEELKDKTQNVRSCPR